MKRILTALVFTAIAAPAFAFHCPADMKKIDAALTTASLSEADLARVRELRARGEAEHASGNHAASVKTLAEAMAILGL